MECLGAKRMMKDYLKNKEVWDSIFIVVNILFCFLLVAILYLKLPRLSITSVVTGVYDNQTAPELNCQFSRIANNPFFFLDIFVTISPVNDTGNLIFIDQTGYQIQRYAETFYVNNTRLQYTIVPSWADQVGDDDSITNYTFVSDFNITGTVSSNEYYLYYFLTGIVQAKNSIFLISSVEGFLLSNYATFIQQMFQNDIFDTQYRPFIPHFLNSSAVTMNEFYSTYGPFQDGLWEQFQIDFTNFLTNLVGLMEIEYICMIVTLEEPVDYFIRLASYSFIIVLVLLFMQLVTNIFVLHYFKGRVKRIRRSYSQKTAVPKINKKMQSSE